MKHIIIFLIAIILVGCRTGNKLSEYWKESLFDTTFVDKEIISIDLIEIEYPMVGGIVDQKRLSYEELTEFLSDIRNIKKHEVLKCMEKYIIRINLANDTFRLKTCGPYISNRYNDRYYALPTKENLIEKYWKK